MQNLIKALVIPVAYYQVIA